MKQINFLLMDCVDVVLEEPSIMLISNLVFVLKDIIKIILKFVRDLVCNQQTVMMDSIMILMKDVSLVKTAVSNVRAKINALNVLHFTNPVKEDAKQNVETDTLFLALRTVTMETQWEMMDAINVKFKMDGAALEYLQLDAIL